VTSLRQLDSKSSEVIIFDEKGSPDYRAHLRHGSFEKLHKSEEMVSVLDG